MRKFTPLALAVAMILTVCAMDAQAGLLRRAPAPQPTPAPAVNQYVIPAPSPMAIGSPCGPVQCCPQPCLTYRHKGIKLRCCKTCEPPQQMVLTACHPCTCCPVAVPVCLPACCCGAPKVTCRGAIIGEGIVRYDWCCGVYVTVRFHKCGDVVVTYHHA